MIVLTCAAPSCGFFAVNLADLLQNLDIVILCYLLQQSSLNFLSHEGMDESTNPIKRKVTYFCLGLRTCTLKIVHIFDKPCDKCVEFCASFDLEVASSDNVHVLLSRLYIILGWGDLLSTAKQIFDIKITERLNFSARRLIHSAPVETHGIFFPEHDAVLLLKICRVGQNIRDSGNNSKNIFSEIRMGFDPFAQLPAILTIRIIERNLPSLAPSFVE